MQNLDWDKSLPKEVMEEIIQFFISLFKLEDVKFPQSLLVIPSWYCSLMDLSRPLEL